MPGQEGRNIQELVIREIPPEERAQGTRNEDQVFWRALSYLGYPIDYRWGPRYDQKKDRLIWEPSAIVIRHPEPEIYKDRIDRLSLVFACHPHNQGVMSLVQEALTFQESEQDQDAPPSIPLSPVELSEHYITVLDRILAERDDLRP